QIDQHNFKVVEGDTVLAYTGKKQSIKNKDDLFNRITGKLRITDNFMVIDHGNISFLTKNSFSKEGNNALFDTATGQNRADTSVSTSFPQKTGPKETSPQTTEEASLPITVNGKIPALHDNSKFLYRI